jgi:hypothetical protein
VDWWRTLNVDPLRGWLRSLLGAAFVHRFGRHLRSWAVADFHEKWRHSGHRRVTTVTRGVGSLIGMGGGTLEVCSFSPGLAVLLVGQEQAAGGTMRGCLGTETSCLPGSGL